MDQLYVGAYKTPFLFRELFNILAQSWQRLAASVGGQD